MNRAYIVTGAESSGTCYLTQLLIDAGCAGKAGGVQPFDGNGYSINLRGDRPERLVIQRSIPHGEMWVGIKDNVKQLRDYGYYVTMLVLARDQYCQERSQVKDGHAHDRRQFLLNVSAAWREAFATILGCGVEFYVVPYAALGEVNYRTWLVGQLDLTGSFETEFIDGDRKYL